ncbi:hypothetical protein ACVIHC_005880 [Bradyrhizobium diazoefficiens]
MRRRYVARWQVCFSVPGLPGKSVSYHPELTSSYLLVNFFPEPISTL